MKRPLLAALGLFFLPGIISLSAADDFRDFNKADKIPSKNYCDQPYIAKLENGEWICMMTTGPGKESEPGQHVVATISADQGRTWSKLIDIEPSGGPEASWVVPFVAPGGRVYAFYDYNADRVNKLGRKTIKATLGGWYVFKYSDDSGRTWSSERYRLPMPLSAADRANDFEGRFQLFWGIDEPEIIDGQFTLSFTRMGKFPHSFGEGWIYKSDNLLAEQDPAKIRWQLFPEGERGFQSDKLGDIQEEHNIVPLSGKGVYCIFRTKLGYPGESYSADGGRTWSEPQIATYTPGGRRIKTPTACPRLFQVGDSKYLLWFHNTSSQQKGADVPVTGRNLGWFIAGIEKDGLLHWSQPELVNYNPNRRRGCSYPDLIEEGGEFYLSSTNKKDARVQHLDRTLLDDLWRQETIREIASKGQVLALGQDELRPGAQAVLPPLPDLEKGGGFSLELWLSASDWQSGQILLETRDASGRRVAVVTGERETLRLELSDGTTTTSWDTDPGLLKPDVLQHVVFTVDGGPKLITVLVDGVLCDGGEDRPFGYGRFHAEENAEFKVIGKDLTTVSTGASLQIAPSFRGTLKGMRLYERPLRTTEAIGNFRVGPEAVVVTGG